MSFKVDLLENKMAKLTIEVPAEDLEKALQRAYQKQKKNISIPGFRKGKVPRAMVEKMYGPAVFYEDAANELIPLHYSQASGESELEIVSRPEIDVVQLEKGKDFIFTAEVALKPDVELGQYKGVEVLKADLEVTDDELAQRLHQEQEKNSRMLNIEDEPAKLNDTLHIDFFGTIDGEPFDGNSAENCPLVLGSGSFIPGFEEQLEGKSLDEEVDVEVTFPEDYAAEELQGKAAVFKCKINKIERKELPELDDDFAQDVSEFDTLEEYKASLREELGKDKVESAKSAKTNAAVAQAVKNAKIDVPDAMLDTEVESSVEGFARNLRNSGLTMEQYVQYTGQTMEMIREQMKEQCLNQIKTRLVLEKIAEVENIEASEETVNEGMERLAENYGMELEKVKELMFATEESLAEFKKELAGSEAARWVADQAVEVDSIEEEPAEENTEA